MPEDSARDSGERLRESVAQARSAISEALGAASERFEREEREAAKRARSRVEDLIAEELRGQLAVALERVESEAGAKLSAIAEAESRVAKRIEAAAEELTVRARRQELKLARAESSRRNEAAMARVEERGAAVRLELERSVEETVGRLAADAEARIEEHWTATQERLLAARRELGRQAAAGEERIEAALARLDRGVGRVERARAEIGLSERRMVDSQLAVVEVEARVAEIGREADTVTDWEGRLHRAAAAEADAARRIREAEERLRATLAQ